jgi:hypothetical protein
MLTEVRPLWRQVLDDEGGGLSVEQIMWLGAGAVVLAFMISVVFPQVRTWLMDTLRTITSFRAHA